MFIILPSLQETFIHTRTMLSSFYIRTIVPVVESLTAILHPSTNYISQIKAVQENHEAAEALKDMINIDGAGAWPPKASHRDSWPSALRPYHDIFLELASLLPVDQVSLDDGINQNRRVEYRTRLQKLLQQRVDLAAVESVLSIAEDTDPSLIRGDAYNGLFACIGNLRHAFR